MPSNAETQVQNGIDMATKLSHMQGMGPKSAAMKEGGVAKPKSAEKDENGVESPQKIALVPFEADPVHQYDGDGNASCARERSVQDDFQLAVQQTLADHVKEVEDQGDSHGQPRDTGAGEGNGDLENGAKKEEATGSGGIQESASFAEHPLQSAVTSFDMALGELNQLVHLVDLARAGEFMALERVTPSDEDQARAMSDQTARPGDGVPPEALPSLVTMKRSQLKGAAEQLRERAKRLRETTRVQLVFQQGVVHLRKSWRIVAPNHGKVNVPLQVGEPLSVDCSFGSAGGKSVPFTAAAGTRHRHPWLFQLTCGEGGRLEAQPSNTQGLKAFEVQLVSVQTGMCEHSLRASFPARSDRCRRMDAAEGYCGKPPPASNGGAELKLERRSEVLMDDLEQHISRLQHSVFWEEVFETLKAEALVDGKDGWLVHQDARCGSDVVRPRTGTPAMGPEVVGRIESGAKRRLVGLSSRGMTSTRNARARVAHVLDDEVMVEMDSHSLLGYRLVSGESPASGWSGRPGSGVPAKGGTYPEDDKSKGPTMTQSASLCQLALLYCGSLIREQQRTQEVAGRVVSSKSPVSREVGAWISAESGGSTTGGATAGGRLSAASTWKSVGRVLLHHLFRSEVVQGLANVSRSMQKIGLPLAVRWTHLEETYRTSALTLTVGHCFHFRASLDDGCGILVSALPGLQNHADQRSVELQSAQDLEHFLLREVCRQIVLTFGDITASWTSGVMSEGAACFRVELEPAAIYLLPGRKAEESGTKPTEELRGSGCEARVYVQGAGVQIACSSWSTSGCTPNGQGPRNEGKAGFLTDTPGRPSETLSTTAATVEVNVAEWDRLDGRDLFQKFSSLLGILYPL
ncbi:unnamed protein product [Ectocarpus sp. 12 AP-2014]